MNKIFRQFGAIALTALLCGCFAQDLSRGLAPLKGRPIADAIAKLGYPNDERVIAGKKIYTWSTDHRGPQLFDSGEVEYNCSIRLYVNAGEVIDGGDFEGNAYGCASYVNLLEK